MSTNSSVETAALAGVACNAILYGVHLVVFPICMFFLIQKKLKGVNVHWILICALIVQFILSTMYISVQLYMIFQSFVRLQPADFATTISSSVGSQSIIAEPSPTWWNTAPTLAPTAAVLSSVVPSAKPILTSTVSGWGSPSQQWSPIAMYWLNTQAKIQILSSTVCFFNTIIGDGILIWRLYAVWEKRLMFCIPPVISLMAGVICASLMIGIQSTSIYSIVNSLAMASWSLSIGTQVISTFLIAFKLKIAGRNSWTTVDANNPYKNLAWIMMESGAIYSAVAFALLIFYSIRKLDIAMVLMGCMGQIAAIIPAMIVILIHFRLPSPVLGSTTGRPSTLAYDNRMTFASFGRQLESTVSNDDSVPSTENSAFKTKEISEM